MTTPPGLDSVQETTSVRVIIHFLHMSWIADKLTVCDYPTGACDTTQLLQCTLRSRFASFFFQLELDCSASPFGGCRLQIFLRLEGLVSPTRRYTASKWTDRAATAAQ